MDIKDIQVGMKVVHRGYEDSSRPNFGRNSSVVEGRVYEVSEVRKTDLGRPYIRLKGMGGWGFHPDEVEPYSKIPRLKKDTNFFD